MNSAQKFIGDSGTLTVTSANTLLDGTVVIKYTFAVSQTSNAGTGTVKGEGADRWK